MSKRRGKKLKGQIGAALHVERKSDKFYLSRGECPDCGAKRLRHRRVEDWTYKECASCQSTWAHSKDQRASAQTGNGCGTRNRSSRTATR